MRGKIEVGEQVTDAIDLRDKVRVDLSVGITAAQTAAFASDGLYDIWCTAAELYIRVAADASGVTTSNGYLLKTGNTITFFVRAGDKVGGILASGTGTLSIHGV